MPRATDRLDFLNRAGWAEAAAGPLAGDASSRRYERLRHPALGAAVLMDAPPGSGEDIRPFIRIADFLLEAGLSAPRLIARDPEHGFLLLEDLGDGIFARLAQADPAQEQPLYEAAVDTLLALHRHSPPGGLPPLGPPEMARAVDVALTWYAPGAGCPAGAAALPELETLVHRRLTALPPAPRVLALRDFHAENLLWLPERAGAARVGLLDFQDAFAGHPVYDLISLLEDARRDVSAATRAAAFARFVTGSGADAEDMSLAAATLGAQRNLRLLGVFARLCMHFAKPHYVDLIPRVWGHLRHDLAHPALADLAQFTRETLPEPTPARLALIKEKCGTCPMP